MTCRVQHGLRARSTGMRGLMGAHQHRASDIDLQVMSTTFGVLGVSKQVFRLPKLFEACAQNTRKLGRRQVVIEGALQGKQPRTEAEPEKPAC